LCPQPDGNCLYRAVEDQLAPEAGAHNDMGHEQLRARAADYMRAHEKEFAPFVLPVGWRGAVHEAQLQFWGLDESAACRPCSCHWD
jgi:OTU-like cysteine protease